MTLALEHLTPTTKHTPGDEALKIIDAHRRDVNDHFAVESLEVEFPSYARSLGGASNVLVARSGDNDAGTFKWRGALVAAHILKERGVDTVVFPSAGNHARGGILAAKILEMRTHVVVPTTAPVQKQEGLRDMGDSSWLHVHTKGRNFDESYAWAQKNLAYDKLVHPYDNEHVIAGQGTLADDIESTFPDVRHIVVPSGGWGLATGIAKRLRELGRTDVIVHGVEAPGSNSMSLSQQANILTSAERPNARFGGSAVRKVGRHAFATWRNQSDSLRVISEVSEDEIDTLISMYEQDRHDNLLDSVPPYEPTSLVAIAGLRKVLHEYPDEPIVVIGTGHNEPLRTTRLHTPIHNVWK